MKRKDKHLSLGSVQSYVTI